MCSLGGYPCDLDEINELGWKYQVPVIEDAAHAFGAIYKEKFIGSISDYTMFSFQAIKHLTTVDGGALCLKYSSDYDKAKLLRWYGIDRDNTEQRKDLRCEADINMAGFKFHMNDVCASIGLANLKIIESVLRTHRSNSYYYDCELYDTGGIRLLKREKDRYSSFWLYTMRVDDRDNFIEAMKSRGVMTSKVHARNDEYSCTARFKKELPNVDLFYSEMVSIPVGYHIDNEKREFIVDCIRKGW